MLVKIHKTYRDIVAVCDSELLGKTFEEKGFQLYVKENFFNGEEVSEDKLVRLMQKMAAEDATFNIVGARAVKSGLRAGIISKEGIKKIQGVPFAMVLV